MIDFSKYEVRAFFVRRIDDLYKYELEGAAYSKPVPFEDMPLEIQERVAILLTAPEETTIKGVGWRLGARFFLKDH